MTYAPVTLPLVVTAALTGLSGSGCLHDPVRPIPASDAQHASNSSLLWMSPVVIVPVCENSADPKVLMVFCHELAVALQGRGVSDVVIQGDCERPCPGDPPDPAAWAEPVPANLPSVRMHVAVQDFRAYRPMRLAVDVRLVQVSDQSELHRIVDVFQGPREPPLVEYPPRFRWFPELKREQRIDRIAPTAFLTNSPGRFLTRCAYQVTDRLGHHGVATAPTP